MAVSNEYNFRFVRCSACGIRADNLTDHIDKSHGGVDAYIALYPTDCVTSQEMASKYPSASRQKALYHMQSQEYRQSRREQRLNNKEQMEIVRNLGRSMLGGKHSQETKDLIRAKRMAYLSDNKNMAQQLEWLSQAGRGKRCKYTNKLGKVINTRSYWESSIAFGLDVLNYDWEYEPLPPIPYLDSLGVCRNYIPDFYLPNIKLVIEVNGIDENKSSKFEGVRRMGKRILEIDRDDELPLTFVTEEMDYKDIYADRWVDRYQFLKRRILNVLK